LVSLTIRSMSEHTSTNNTAAEAWDGQNVISVSFEDDHNAYKALTMLEELDSQRRLAVREAVVVARAEDGKIVSKDRVESSSFPGTASGGLIGLLIGILGGPVGVLVGGTYGLIVGSMFDIYDADEADSALGEISSSVKIGQTALVAVVDEQSADVVDAAMADIGGVVARRPVADVEAEIAAAEDAERKAKHEARKELDRARRERDKATVNAKLDQLKGKLHHGQHSESAEPDGATVATADSER
jgi:uncharacterized membrane protein